MKLDEFKLEIKNFKKNLVVYKKYLEDTSDSMNNINFDDDKVSNLRSSLVQKYAALERYIKRIGQNPQMHDGVWATLYSVYDNGLSTDILARVLPSIGGILTDLDYILGKLESMTVNEFDKLFTKKQVDEANNKPQTEKLPPNYWNYVNPFWLVWNFLKFFWNNLFISMVATVVGGLIVAYFVWRLGWL